MGINARTQVRIDLPQGQRQASATYIPLDVGTCGQKSRIMNQNGAVHLRLGGPDTLKRELQAAMDAAAFGVQLPLRGSANGGPDDQRQLDGPKIKNQKSRIPRGACVRQ